MTTADRRREILRILSESEAPAAARDLAADHLGTGGFQITACVSTAP